MRFAWVNGANADAIALEDRGLHYGDGLFETLAVRAGAAAWLDYHLERLARGCAALRLPVPPLDVVQSEIHAAALQLQQGVLKLIVTRGRAGRGYRPPAVARPTRMLLAYDAPGHPPEWPADGVRVRTCRTRLGSNPALAGVKHLNRLEQVLARGEWDDPAIAEGLMLDQADQVICATSANVYAVVDGVLVTPELERCGVAGVMRRVVMETAARAEIPLVVRVLAAAELARASELMLSNSLIGLWRVRDLDGRALSAQDCWQRLRAALDARGEGIRS